MGRVEFDFLGDLNELSSIEIDNIFSIVYNFTLGEWRSIMKKHFERPIKNAANEAVLVEWYERAGHTVQVKSRTNTAKNGAIATELYLEVQTLEA